MKILIMIFSLILSMNAYGAWEEKSVLYDMKGTDRESIREVIRTLEVGSSNILLKENLTSLKPIEVESASVKTVLYQWKNDKSCTVSDPTTIKNILFQHFTANYTYFSNNGPEELYILAIPLFKNPCTSSNVSELVSRKVIYK